MGYISMDHDNTTINYRLCQSIEGPPQSYDLYQFDLLTKYASANGAVWIHTSPFFLNSPAVLRLILLNVSI